MVSCFYLPIEDSLFLFANQKFLFLQLPVNDFLSFSFQLEIFFRCHKELFFNRQKDISFFLVANKRFSFLVAIKGLSFFQLPINDFLSFSCH